jgi:hypothetical protein
MEKKEQIEVGGDPTCCEETGYLGFNGWMGEGVLENINRNRTHSSPRVRNNYCSQVTPKYLIIQESGAGN